MTSEQEKEQSMMPREIREAVEDINHNGVMGAKIESVLVVTEVAQLHLQAASELPERRKINTRYHHLCFGGSSCCEMLDTWSDENIFHCKHAHYKNWGVPACEKCDGKHEVDEPEVEPYQRKDVEWNACLDQATIVVAKKNEEVAMLKKENEGYKNLIKNCPQAQVCPYVKTISFTPDLELAKKVIEEQREELEACRDANAQKKKRIAELEKLVEERSVNTGWAKAVEIEQEKVVLVNKIDELEDALKRAEGK